jgi:hypothetical protein
MNLIPYLLENTPQSSFSVQTFNNFLRNNHCLLGGNQRGPEMNSADEMYYVTLKLAVRIATTVL